MINIIAGKTGSGKSAFLGRKVAEALKNGDTVYSYERFRFKDPRVKYFHKIEEIAKLENCLVVLDEAQIWLNSRKWDQLPTSLQYALSQERHSGIDIWAATQHVNRIDTVMRELVHHYYEISRVAGTTLKSKNIVGKDGVAVKTKVLKGVTTRFWPNKPWQLSKMIEYDILRANNVTRSVGTNWIWNLFNGWTMFGKADFDRFDSYAKFVVDNGGGDFEISEVTMYRCRTCGKSSIKEPR